MNRDDIPNLPNIRAAAQLLGAHIIHTPLLRSDEFDQRCEGRVLLKAEPLQRTGSFKIRGALNRVMQLKPAERKAGVVAWSSGNHAQGVAAAAAQFGVSATIVMPRDAPTMKIENTRALGAEIVLYDRATQDREVIARDIALQRKSVVIPSYDDPYIIAGQGTAGLEIVAQANEMGLDVDDVVVPASGGGLIAGVALAVHGAFPQARIYAAEPEGYDDHGRSLAQKMRVTNASKANALCDALLAPMPGELTWQINSTRLSGGYAVSDDDVCRAMAFAFRHLKLVVEPGGAVALAAVLSGRHITKNRTTVVVLSGGNVDAGTFQRCLDKAASADP
jgi:threonine dehydratase